MHKSELFFEFSRYAMPKVILPPNYLREGMPLFRSGVSGKSGIVLRWLRNNKLQTAVWITQSTPLFFSRATSRTGVRARPHGDCCESEKRTLRAASNREEWISENKNFIKFQI